MESQESNQSEDAPPPSPPPPACRHEHVRVYQRKLRGLERRLVSTPFFLPVGLKMGDFGHLSEGSYCFCTKCRARLFPKRTAAEKAQARLAARDKVAADAAAAEDADLQEAAAELADESSDEVDTTKISVEELEVVALELEDLGDSKAEIVEEEEEEDEL